VVAWGRRETVSGLSCVHVDNNAATRYCSTIIVRLL